MFCKFQKPLFVALLPLLGIAVVCGDTIRMQVRSASASSELARARSAWQDEGLDRTLSAQYVPLDARNRLSGTMSAIDRSGEVSGVGGLEVALVQNGRLIAETVTQSDGSFLSDEVSPGAYTLCVSGDEGFLAYGIQLIAREEAGETLPMPAPGGASIHWGEPAVRNVSFGVSRPSKPQEDANAPAPDLRKQLEHLRSAQVHLREAGMDEVAASVGERITQLEKQLREAEQVQAAGDREPEGVASLPIDHLRSALGHLQKAGVEDIASTVEERIAQMEQPMQPEAGDIAGGGDVEPATPPRDVPQPAIPEAAPPELAAPDRATPAEEPSVRVTAAVIPPKFTALQSIMADFVPEGVALPVEGLPESMRINVEESVVAGGFRITLNDDGALEGQISPLASEGDEPIRLKEMNAFLLLDDEIYSRVTVKEDGNFVFNDVEPGVYGFAAAGPDGFAAISFQAVAATSGETDASHSSTSPFRNASFAHGSNADVNRLEIAISPKEDLEWLRNRINELNASEPVSAGEETVDGQTAPFGPGFGSGGSGFGGGGAGSGSGFNIGPLVEGAIAAWLISEAFDRNRNNTQRPPISPFIVRPIIVPPIIVQ